MPQAIALVATFAATLGSGVVASTAIYYGVSAALYLGLSVGLQFLAQALFAPKAPKPEDVQHSVKQPQQPRARHYGRVKISGPWVFAESDRGRFFKVLALGQGPLDAIEEYWIDDNLVEVNPTTHEVETVPYIGKCNIESRLGAATETAYAELISIFPEYTSAHRGDGVASLYAKQRPVDAEIVAKVFPNLIETPYRVVARGAKVFDYGSETTVWHDNAANIIRDYMTHQDGMRLPLSIFTTAEAGAAWEAAHAVSIETVPLKAGGIENRYRLWGSYFLNERPADVLGRMLACCDGRLYPTADGGLALDIGEWAEPSVVLDEETIVGFTDVSGGKDILNTANVVRATYLGVDHDYQSADADPWIDAADVSLRGEIEKEVDFAMAPSHSQARRLMKLAAHRANPRWVGNFQCNLGGLAALGERFVRITLPMLEIDAVFEVQDCQIIVGEGNILQGVTVQVLSLPAAAYEWDPDTEEGEAPQPDETDDDAERPVPTGFGVTLASKVVSGVSIAYALLAWDVSPQAGLVPEARGKATADAAWITIPVASNATTAESFALADATDYEFQVRYRGGDWTPSEVLETL